VQEHQLPVVMKSDGPKGGAFPAVEVEALGQGLVTGIIRAALDALLPEPLETVRVREERERTAVRRRLAAEGDPA
jgi:hypothetical protein